MDGINYHQVIAWVFYGTITALGGILTVTIRKLADGVTELNVKIATVIEKTLNHEKELGRHESRIEFLERNSNGGVTKRRS